MLNPEGKCFTFDSRGSGYGRGEGVATIIVKRLSDAIQDGDSIHAVIRNTGSNQDGKTNGITLPNSASQEALIRSVYQSAALDPRHTLYVEAHGTGTVAGDSAEVKAIASFFTEEKRPHDLPVGSVKTNLGHMEATSGLGGLFKAVMVLKKRQIPPNLNFLEPKKGLDLEKRQIKVSSPSLPNGELVELTSVSGPPELGTSGSYGPRGSGPRVCSLVRLRRDECSRSPRISRRHDQERPRQRNCYQWTCHQW
jgi:acyl transferase domain-containing protein